MRRRQVLGSIAMGGVFGAGVGVTPVSAGRLGDVSKYDYLWVVNDGKTVDKLDDPTWDEVRAAELMLPSDYHFATPNLACITYCAYNCPCHPCIYGCIDCCDPSENICEDC